MRSSVQTQVEVTQGQYKQLEQKLLEADKEKQSLLEEKCKAVAAVEQEVLNSLCSLDLWPFWFKEHILRFLFFCFFLKFTDVIQGILH